MNSNPEHQRPMTTEEIYRQMDAMRRRKEAFLNMNVIRTEPVSGKIQWSVWSEAPCESFGLGHGIHYHDIVRSGNDVVAFIRGFAWRRSNQIACGYHIQPDAVTTQEVIDEMKKCIEKLICDGTTHYRWIDENCQITPRIYARGNC
jgi:hypothetical protein